MTNFLSGFGRIVLSILTEVGQIIQLLGNIIRYFPRVFKDRGLVLEQMKIVGSDSLPLVVLVGSFTGAIAALQATNLFAKFNLIGIARPFIGGSIAKSRYLGMPRVMAAITMMPVLAIFSNAVALVGAYALTSIKFGFSVPTFFLSIQQFFSIEEIARGVIKSFVFGGFTAIIGCHVGFQTDGGAEGVGKSTVRAFTISAASILVIDALFGVVF
jgi:phospholipid/cholesterol/gamma-HCH transport system permease protein